MKKSGQTFINVSLSRKELEGIILEHIRTTLGPARLIGFNIEEIDVDGRAPRDDSDAVIITLIKELDL